MLKWRSGLLIHHVKDRSEDECGLNHDQLAMPTTIRECGDHDNRAYEDFLHVIGYATRTEPRRERLGNFRGDSPPTQRIPIDEIASVGEHCHQDRTDD